MRDRQNVFCVLQMSMWLPMLPFANYGVMVAWSVYSTLALVVASLHFIPSVTTPE